MLTCKTLTMDSNRSEPELAIYSLQHESTESDWELMAYEVKSEADPDLVTSDPTSEESQSCSEISLISAVQVPAIDQSCVTTCREASCVSPAKSKHRSPHKLPLCRVCGVQATGYHYGINSCEACKGFFRRSLIRKSGYKCLKNEKCIIKAGKRNVCAYCRYERCLRVGMSVEGIKIGRYTYEKRTKDLLEVRELHMMQNSVQIEAMDQEKKEKIENLILKIKEAQLKQIPNSIEQYSQVPLLHQQFRERFLRSLSLPSCDIILTGSSGLCFVKENQAKNERGDQTEPPDNLDTSGFQKEYHFKLINHWLGILDKGMKGIVNFAKDIPGFKQLDLADQTSLIKHSVCEVWLVARHKAFDVQDHIFTAYNGFTFDIKKALGEEFCFEVLTVVSHVQNLKFVPEEVFLLKAHVMFFTDRTELVKPEQVEAIQFEIQEALEYLFRKNHPDDPLMFCKLINLLRELRVVTHHFEKYIDKLKVFTTTGDVNIPPLFFEVIS